MKLFPPTLLAVMTTLGFAQTTQAALPPESALPNSIVAQPKQLPNETSLPEAMRVREQPQQLNRTPQETTEPAGRDPVTETPGPRALPPETALPRPENAAQEVDPPGPLPLDGSPDGIPWLRLNMRGHTAPVRSVVFVDGGNRLCSAGDDKSLVVWSAAAEDPDAWRYERTVRWQVQRATRGRVYDLAEADGSVVIAGEGAMGGLGEMVLVDPVSGDYRATLFDEANGHRQVVVAVDSLDTPQGAVIASLSMDGRTLLWRKNDRGVWRPSVAARDDVQSGASPAEARRRLTGRAFSAITVLDAERVVAPALAEMREGRLVWRLNTLVAGRDAASTLGADGGPDHWDYVTAISPSADRKKLVSADGAGGVFLWDLTAQPAKVTRLQRPDASVALSLSLSADGGTLAIGTAIAPRQGTASVEVWDVSNPSTPRRLSQVSASGHVLACACDAESQHVAYCQGDRVVVSGWRQRTPKSVLSADAETPFRVAFAAEEPFYRIGIAAQPDRDGAAVFTHTFDCQRLRLTRGDTPQEAWYDSADIRGGWSIAAQRDASGARYWALSENGAAKGRLPLDEALSGVFTNECWIPSHETPDRPTMAAIGTSGGDIYLVRVGDDVDAPTLRRFRGHNSSVSSLAVSPDLRWLVSAARDATVRVWPLDGALAGDATTNLWGATFEVDDEGDLMIASIREEGPLYFRSARLGDVVVSCEWADGGEVRSTRDPAEMLAVLSDPSRDRVLFELRTGRQPSRKFQMLPAWQQLVSLAMDGNGEWAYWAPSGYYDASFEGHRLFGWQINRGIERLPDYFLAAQFRGALERPDVMSHLLDAGSVEQAFRQAHAVAPADSAQAIANAYRLKPEVSIVAPKGAVLGEDPRLQAWVRTPAGQTLREPKAFANGVVAPRGQIVEEQVVENGVRSLYEWRLALPAEPQVLVQVVAATDEEITAQDQMVFENTTTRPESKPNLFLLAAGVDQYRDAAIPRLRTPVERTESLTQLLRVRADGLYRVSATALLGDRVTRPAWRSLTETLAEKLRTEAAPDDLLVFFLSGHGVQDPESKRYHYITADADYAEVMGGAYADCLSSEDLAAFADVSCRKIVILDTCHSGAIQPMRHREMKGAVRALQEDMLITIAASQGAEEAVEGRFSSRLLQALRGVADSAAGDGDGVVRMDELVAFLRRAVTEDSLGDSVVQTPSAGPVELLHYLTIPLAEAGSEQTLASPVGVTR